MDHIYKNGIQVNVFDLYVHYNIYTYCSTKPKCIVFKINTAYWVYIGDNAWIYDQ